MRRMPWASSATTVATSLWSAVRLTRTIGTPAAASSSLIPSRRLTVAMISPSTLRASRRRAPIASRAGSLSVLAMIAVNSPPSASSMPRSMGGNSGLVMSGISTPTVIDRRVRRLEAMALRA